MEKFLRRSFSIQKGLLVLIFFFIGWEWIKTLPVLTDTDAGYLFLFRTVFIANLLIYYLLPRLWMRLIAVPIFIFYWYQSYYWDTSFFAKEWIKGLGSQLLLDGQDLIRFKWMGVEPSLRTLVFYFLLWIIVHIIYKWVIEKGYVFIWFFVSILYFSVLDTFLLFDGKLSVIKTLFLGLMMLGIGKLDQVEKSVGRRIPGNKVITWVSVTLTISLLFTLVGYVAPKQGPTWPNPITFWESLKAGNWEGGQGVRYINKTGYGDDDTYLGGPYFQSNEIVFISQLTGSRYPSHYWRGESKDVYTGHGWEARHSQEIAHDIDSKFIVPEHEIFSFENPYVLTNLSGEFILEKIETYRNNQILFTGGQPAKFYPDEWLGTPQRQLNVDIEHFRFTVNEPLKLYRSESLIPTIVEDEMLAIGEHPHFPQQILDQYLQLPASLPERVKELASTIVGDETNQYKKVLAIERYLRQGPFIYDIENVPVPSLDQDFVDQFLFDSQIGYCDHFSTSMVVMLRAEGIPARWVKGFAPGELFRTDQDSQSHFTQIVREKDAHSWVEVYFPEVGWLPFEPTKSFVLPYEIVRPTVNLEDTFEEIPERDRDMERNRNEEVPELIEEDIGGGAGSAAIGSKRVSFGIILSVILALVGVLAILLRESILIWFLSGRLVRLSGVQMVVQAYRFILQWLGKMFIPREKHQTVREYVASLEMTERSGKMLEMTKIFEKARYGNQPPEMPKGQFMRKWQEFMQWLRT